MLLIFWYLLLLHAADFDKSIILSLLVFEIFVFILVEVWHDENDYWNNDEVVGWYNSHKQRKIWINKAYKEMLPVAWYPSHYWDWCMPEDEKKRDRKVVEW